MITQHYLQHYAMTDWYKLLVAQRNEWWWVIQPSMKREQVYNFLFLLLLLFCKKVRLCFCLSCRYLLELRVGIVCCWQTFVCMEWVQVSTCRKTMTAKNKTKNENTPATKTTTINKTSITGTITTAITTTRRSKRNEKVTKVHRCNDVCNDLFYWIC